SGPRTPTPRQVEELGSVLSAPECVKPSGRSVEKMAKLDTYKRKRDPRRTPEPFGGRPGAGGPIFVVQRHDARRLHYDFRLERDGKEENWLLIRRRDHDAEPFDPKRYRPMLATLASELPKGKDWRYEVKWDGYRALAYVRGGECELVSRNGNLLTPRFSQVAQAVPRALRTPSAVLDGEVCALD